MWVLTTWGAMPERLADPTEDGSGLCQSVFEKLMADGVVEWVGQLEVAPETGRVHLQSAVRLQSGLVMTQSKLIRILSQTELAGSHVEARRTGSGAAWSKAVLYCTKEKSRAPAATGFRALQLRRVSGRRGGLGRIRTVRAIGAF